MGGRLPGIDRPGPRLATSPKMRDVVPEVAFPPRPGMGSAREGGRCIMAVGEVSGGLRRDVRASVFLALMVLIGSSTATAAKFAVRELPIGLVPIVRFGG